MISITEKNNKIYIVQDSGEYEKKFREWNAFIFVFNFNREISTFRES